MALHPTLAAAVAASHYRLAATPSPSRGMSRRGTSVIDASAERNVQAVCPSGFEAFVHTPSRWVRAKGKLSIIRVFSGASGERGRDGAVMKAMSDALQQNLDASIDLYAVDVAKWIRVFFDSPILQR